MGQLTTKRTVVSFRNHLELDLVIVKFDGKEYMVREIVCEIHTKTMRRIERGKTNMYNVGLADSIFYDQYLDSMELK